METFAWSSDLNELHKTVTEICVLKEKERHAKYYRENRKKILRKQKKADAIRDRKSKQYYEENKERILAANNKRYWDNVEERRRKAREYYHKHKEEILRRRKMLTKEERLRALLGNIKNWSWDVYPKFSIDKEDAQALLDHFNMALKQEEINQ